MKRTWLVELGLGCLGAVVGCWFLAGSVSEGDGAPVGVEIVAGVLAFVALVAFRRRRPLGLTLALIPAGILLALPMGFTPVALFAVGLHRRARVTVAVTALHTVAVSVVYLIALGATRFYVEVTGFLVLLHVLLAAVAMLIRSHRMLVRSWADRARDAQEGERLRLEQARLAERERIAREMHDSLAHRISLLAVHAGALEVRRDAPADERQAAAVVRQGAYDALEDLRGVIKMLREPSDDRPQPALADVPALVEESREAGARIDLTLTVREPVPAGVGRHAYRIIQEALTNARKHAPGAKVTVAVTGRAEEGLLVEVGNGQLPGALAAGTFAAGALAAGAGGHDRAVFTAPPGPGSLLEVDSPRGAVLLPGGGSLPGGSSPGVVSSPGGGFLHGGSSRGGSPPGVVSSPGGGFLPGGSRPGGGSSWGGGFLSGGPRPGGSSALGEGFLPGGSRPGGGSMPGGGFVPGGGSVGFGGFGALPGAGAGLVGLRERVQLAGGRLEHGPTDEGHFRLRAWLPWHP